MVNNYTLRSGVPDVARRIENDIRSKGLLPGEAYLTAQQAGQMLGVHPRTASRAMKLLADRDVLVRRRRAGTFIGHNVSTSRPTVRTVHIFISSARARTGLSVGDVIDGVREALPEFDVQLDALPPQNAARYVRDVFEKGAADGTMAGAVMMGCPLAIQQYVAAQDLPVVLFGSVYPSTQGLHSVDIDHFQAGYQMAQYLIGRGRRRLALVLRDNWLPGDNLLLDGIQQAMAEAKIPQGALTVRSLPTDGDVASREITQLLTADVHPDGIMCRGQFFVETMLDVLESVNWLSSESAEFAFEDAGDNAAVAQQFAHVRARVTFKEEACLAGRMLAGLIAGRTTAEPHYVIPVEFAYPTSTQTSLNNSTQESLVNIAS